MRKHASPVVMAVGLAVTTALVSPAAADDAAELGRIRSAERAVTEVESKVDRPAVDELTAASAGPTAMIHR